MRKLQGTELNKKEGNVRVNICGLNQEPIGTIYLNEEIKTQIVYSKYISCMHYKYYFVT